MDYQSNNVTDCIIDAYLKLEKGLLVLGDLTTEHSFDGDFTDEVREAWTFEYHRITTLMDIAFDYMSEARFVLEQAREIDKEARRKGGASK